MRFQKGDDTDKRLAIAAAHEYLRAQIAFDAFTRLAADNWAGRQDKRHLLSMYDAYARFLLHLYEFYVACISREQRDTAQLPSSQRDSIIQNEVVKLRRNRADRISRGDAPRWMGPARQYETPVPRDFAAHFRQARNRTAHADHRRVLAEPGISLADFYEQYHDHVMVLFDEAHWLWDRADLESADWAELVEFNFAVSGDGRNSARLLGRLVRLRATLAGRLLQAGFARRRESVSILGPVARWVFSTARTPAKRDSK